MSIARQVPPNYLVGLPPPTPNGSLHVGHIAGPFLAADVFLKAQKLAGSSVRSVTYSDVNQSYVQASAARLGVSPAALSDRCGDDIFDVLHLYGCDVDRFAKPDATSNAFVYDIVQRLLAAGHLVRKPFSFFFSPRLNRFLGEAEVSGWCPNCLDRCKCGICEGCAVINSAENLLAPFETASQTAVLEMRTADVLVLELEAHRPAIEAYFAAHRSFRPRYRWLVEDALRRPLPDFPVSVPGDWGIAMRDALEGQVVNPWAEVMGQFLFHFKAEAQTLPGGGETRIVNFFGFDNSYFYAIVHIAMLGALGEMAAAPFAVMINEFYDTGNEKFSTSRGNVIWAVDLASRHDPDLVRFYLALAGPGFERADFTEATMVDSIERRIGRPWRTLANNVNALLATANTPVPRCDPIVLAAADAAMRRITASFTLERFHLRQGAVDIINLLEFTCSHAVRQDVDAAQKLTDLSYLINRFARALYPVCPGAALRIMSHDRISAAGDDAMPLERFQEALFESVAEKPA